MFTKPFGIELVNYARELKLINQAIELFGDCRSLDQSLINLVLKRHPFWSKGRPLSIIENEIILF